MNKKLLLILISAVILVIVILAGYYLIFGRNSALANSNLISDMNYENNIYEDIKRANQEAKENSPDLTEEEKKKIEENLNQTEKDLVQIVQNII